MMRTVSRGGSLSRLAPYLLRSNKVDSVEDLER